MPGSKDNKSVFSLKKKELTCEVVPAMDSKDEHLHEKIIAFVHKISGIVETESPVWVEHSYAARTAENKGPKSFLMHQSSPCPHCEPQDTPTEMVIDIEGFEKPPLFPLSDDTKSPLDGPITEQDAATMEDDEEDGGSWEKQIYDSAQTAAHRVLAMDVIDIICSCRMWKLCNASLLAASTHARKLRKSLANHWADGSVSWLHQTLNAHLPKPFLVVYNEMLSQLQNKIPELLERLPASNIPAAVKKPLLPETGLKPTLPVLLIAPTPHSYERWRKALAPFFIVHNVDIPKAESSLSVTDWIATLYGTCKANIRKDTNSSYILVGIGPCGSALAISFAASTGSKASSLICVCAPMNTLNGLRGQAGDALLKLMIPTLFVMPQNGTQCIISQTEEVRSRMICHTQMLVIGSADDHLRPNSNVLRRNNVSTDMVDLAVAEEMHRFVTTPPEENNPKENYPASKKQKLVGDRPSSPSPPIILKEQTVPSSGSTTVSCSRTDILSPNKIMDLPIVFADDAESTPSPAQTASSSISDPSQPLFKKVIIARKPNFQITSSKVLRPATVTSTNTTRSETTDHQNILAQNNIRILPMPEKININPTGKIMKKFQTKIIGTANSLKIVSANYNTKNPSNGSGGIKIIKQNKI